MDDLSSPPSFEQSTVYQLASTWLDPNEDQDMREWLLSLTHPDPEQRLKSDVFSRRQSRDPRMIIPLLVALHDPEIRVRSAAAHALLFFRDRRAVEPLIAVLRDAGARSSAALALGLLHDDRAVEPLLIVFQEDIARRQQQAEARGRLLSSDHDLEMMIGALAGLGDQRAVEPLITVLPKADWHLTSCVARALGQLQDRRAIEPLLAALQKMLRQAQQVKTAQEGKDLWLRPEELFRVLGTFGERRAVAPLLTFLAQTRLRAWDRKWAIDALGQIRDERAVEPLCAVLCEKPLVTRVAAARALGLLGDTRAVEVLCAALLARSAHLRAAAARALGQIGERQAVEPLMDVLQDSRISVRRAALWALCQMEDERAVEPLICLLQQGSGPQRRAAAKALGRIGDERAVEPLVTHHDQDSTVRTAIRKALEKLRPTATLGEAARNTLHVDVAME